MSYEETYNSGLLIEHTGQFFALALEPVSIGRADDNSLVLEDPEVSAHHATIYWQAVDGLYYIEDLGSRNGTYVNERRVVEPQQLRQGDVIRVGNTIMDLNLRPAADGAPEMLEAAYLPPEEAQPDDKVRKLAIPAVIVVLLGGVTVACMCLIAILLLTRGGDSPTIVIQSPPDGVEILVGNELILQATASGVSDITEIELSVDDVIVATNASSKAGGISSLSVQKAWIFDQSGEHVISSVARTASGKTSRTESVQVMAVASGSGATPTPTDTAEAPTPTPEPGAPQIEYIRANPQSISAGECTTLEWGDVTDAAKAWIDPDVGGVATPGSTQVCPAETTTYVLTAEGPGGKTTASTTVSVSALADLTIDSITFDPNPAVQGENTGVNITVRNQGSGDAGAFDWEWQAGSDAAYGDRLRTGLRAGETTVVSLRWVPANADPNLPTLAKVDTNNEVAEANEDNNEFASNIQVVESAPGPGSITLESEAALDGYRGSDSSGSTRQDILVGNGEMTTTAGELVWRGFMSFDLSGVASGTTIESAELRFYQAKVGGNPYGKLGGLIVDHVDFGSSLDADDFDAPALDSAALPQMTNSRAWYIIPAQKVADWIEQDLAAGRSHFQLRLRFTQEVDGDGNEDYAGIESANDFFGTGNVPEVEITFQP